MTNQQDTLWYRNAIFYQVYIRAFADGNGDGMGDLCGLEGKLDYLKELGVDCIWLSPMYPSPLKDDGYDISDFSAIHPDYGSLDAFKSLVQAAHQRGLRLIADMPINHTSDQHPWFQSARSDRSSPYRGYYVWSDSDQKYSQARIIFLDTEKSNWTWDDSAGQFFWHRFYSCQPDLNYDNPAVQAEIINIIRYWLDLGLDGFRVDAVPYLFEREGTNCENLPETHGFIKKLRSMVDEEYPGRIMLAEANQAPHDLRPYLGDGDEFHMAFHFPLMPRVFMAIRRGEVQPILDVLKDTPPIPATCQWATFLRNHDELTLEMVTPEERQWMWQEYAPEARMRLNLGIRRRLAPLLDGDRQRIELANALLYSLPGVPVIYYGDEIGMGDNIWLNDRNGVRTPMQWNAGINAGFSGAPPKKLYAPVNSEAVYGYKNLNVEDQMIRQDSLWHALRRLTAARKSHPAFAIGSLEFVPSQSPALLAVLRRSAEEKILALSNCSPQPLDIRLTLPPALKNAVFDNLLNAVPPLHAQGDRLDIHLDGWGYLWLCKRWE